MSQEGEMGGGGGGGRLSYKKEEGASRRFPKILFCGGGLNFFFHSKEAPIQKQRIKRICTFLFMRCTKLPV